MNKTIYALFALLLVACAKKDEKPTVIERPVVIEAPAADKEKEQATKEFVKPMPSRQRKNTMDSQLR